jgi:hypothetical protein
VPGLQADPVRWAGEGLSLMGADDYVVCLADPDLYGVGVVREVLDPHPVTGEARLRVEFDGQVDEFGAFELELASVFYAGRRNLEAA